MLDAVKKIKDEVTFEKVVLTAIKTPGVKIDRAKFLHKELIKYYPEEIVKDAIETNPAKAGVSKQTVNKISKQVINYETTKATGLSVATSIPGGAIVVGATVADITTYFVFIIRVVQELAYLYGFEQFDLTEDDIDAETMNFLLLFVGVMFGVQGSANTLRKFSEVLANNISKKLAKKALTNGTIYPIVKKIATKVGIRMTKQIFADGVASSLPIVSGALSGGLTYAMFKPGCMKLRKNLMSYNLCDPEYY